MSFADAVVVIGHRGAAGLAPENTLPSFRRAYACGVSAVELDVYVVQGELVVIHDATLQRTTNGSGPVMGHSLAALRALDAGDGWPVPLLSEVIAELPAGVGLNVELKGPETAAPVAEELARHSGLDSLVSSFTHPELRRFRELDGHTPVAPLFARWRPNAWRIAAALDARAVNLSRTTVTRERLTEARRRGLQTFIYTVNDLAEARRFIAWGAAGLFTDYPDRITAAALMR
ncbi:MAG: glycerophosphodiester phosphodiesterase family protein [Gammaproteobacteria bacterium]|nr:glycerophosphodiester phosphodiesterase family protein [Gammaproteobacteria bacterium]